jgi:hypothetical protein
MKQKNFSKVPFGEGKRSPLWTTVSAAKFLPKCSLVTLLMLVAFLFPSVAKAQTAIMPVDQKIPAAAVFGIGATPTTGQIDAGNYVVQIDTLVKPAGFAVEAVTSLNRYPSGIALAPGDVYQVSLRVVAKPGYVFAMPSVIAFTHELPTATGVTNWGTQATSVKSVEWSTKADSVFMRVAYQVPKTIDAGHRTIDTQGAATTVVNTLTTFLKAGTVIPTTALRSAATVPTSQWTAALSWTIGTTTGPAPAANARFTAEQLVYVAHAKFTPSAGYTFIGVPANGITWSSWIVSATASGRTSIGPAGGEATAPFTAFSRFPAKVVNAVTKPLAGQLATGVAITSPAGWLAQSNWSWDKGLSTSNPATARFMPDSVYKLTFYVDANTGATPPYGFFGMADNYYTAGTNIESIVSKNKTAWKAGMAPPYNTTDTIVVTFKKTEANLGHGNVIIEQPIPGTGNTHAVGDILETTIPGAPTAVFEGWFDGGVLAVEVDYLAGGDTIFKPNKTYELRVTLIADDDHTVYADFVNADFAEKYTAGDSTAVFMANVGGMTYKRARYSAQFKTPATLPTGTLGIPQPIAGLKVGDRKTIPTTPTAAAGSLYPRLAGYEIEWYEVDGTTLTLLDDADVFAPEKKYTARVIVKPLPQYTMFGTSASFGTYLQPTGDINPTYPGAPQYIESRSHTAGSDTVVYNFFPTAYSLVKPYPNNTDTIRGASNAFVAPVAGELPETTVANAIGKYTATIEWFEGGVALAAGARFQAAKTYTAKLTVNAHTANFWSMAGVAESSYFVPAADPTKYTMVSQEDIVISTTENKAVVTYEFAPTGSLITLKDLELNETDLIFPTSGWSPNGSIARPNVGITIPTSGALVIDNDEYTATVNRWERKPATSGSYTLVTNATFNSQGFQTNYLYVVTLDVTPKDGYTVFGLDAIVGASGIGAWAEYTAGGAQVANVVTYTATGGAPAGTIQVQIYFKVPLPAITSISGFPLAQENITPAVKADLASPQYTVTDFVVTKVDGTAPYYASNGDYVADTTYVYNIGIEPATGYTAVGLREDALVTAFAADSVKHAANDLSVLEVYYTTVGHFARDYEIVIRVPAAGEFPATTASTSEVSSTSISWSGAFESGRFVKGRTYSAQVTLDDSYYSFFGVSVNAFSVKDYPAPLAIVGNLPSHNVVVIQFPDVKDALDITPPQFVWVNSGYAPIDASAIQIKNNTALVYVIDDVIVSGTEFTLTSTGVNTIPALETNTAWTVAPISGLPQGNHTATLTLYYHVDGAPATVFQTDRTISLNVYPVGVNNPEVGELSAFSLNGTLTVKGLVAGEPFSVHNAQGVLIYRGIAKSSDATITVPVKGVYVVTSADKALKVINK